MSIVCVQEFLDARLSYMCSAKTDTNVNRKLADIVIDEAIKHVIFDGWSDQTLKKVCIELKFSEHKVRQIFPRGGVDMALAFHQRDDERFFQKFIASNSSQPNQRIRDRIESAINGRLEIAFENKEAVKRSVSLLATPLYLSEGTRALWGTSDKIWVSIGDKSDDLNWYSKRLILLSVFSAALVFWIEDDSLDFSETRDFVKRRIRNVMEIESFKGKIRKSDSWQSFVNKFKVSALDIIKRKEHFPGL